MNAIRVDVVHQDGSWWATSQDVPGWAALADTREDLARLIREGAGFAFNNRPYVLCEGITPTSLSVS